MATTRKTITISEKQDRWIKAQIAAGDFTNDSEYIRDLIRRDQAEATKYQALKNAIREGLESGVSDKQVSDVWLAAESRHRESNG